MHKKIKIVKYTNNIMTRITYLLYRIRNHFLQGLIVSREGNFILIKLIFVLYLRTHRVDCCYLYTGLISFVSDLVLDMSNRRST